MIRKILLVASLFLRLIVCNSLEESWVRELEDVNDFEYDLSTFSVRFEKCQYVKMFDDELAEDEDSESVLAMKHFVIYELCQTSECDTCDGPHGRYVLDVADYLDATVDFQKEEFENMCENCNERCNNDGDYCSGCGKLCYQYDNLEANGYVDASDYLECQELQMDGDDDDNNDDGVQIYIGPKCSSDGTKILLGLFSDENCWEAYDAEPEDILGMQISYHVLANSHTSDGSICLSCLENNGDNDDDDGGDQADEDNVNEMCEALYAASAKCESKTGITQGFVDVNREDGDYENQVENEFMVCNFIDSLIWNSYTETGDINIYEQLDEVIRNVTPLQTMSMAGLAIALLGLGGYAAYLHREIDNNYPTVPLATQGDGQMA